MKNINKLVNCIIPAHNVARYLPDAINSIINQTIGFENINLVIVNDGSTDETASVIGIFQKLFSGIVCLTQRNHGVSTARNAGLDFCQRNFSAPYTCFLDGDDKYDLNQMQKLIDFLEKRVSKIDFNDDWCLNAVFLPIKLFEREENLHYQYRIIDRGESRIIDLNKNTIWFSHVNSAMFRTEAVINERFDENLSISEDASFLLQVLLKTNLAGWYNEGIYYHLRKRMDESSVIDGVNSNPISYERISLYRKEFENYVNTLGGVPRAVQSSRLYDIHWFRTPDADPVKHGIDIDIDKALNDIKFIIQNIDADLLEQEYITYWFRAYFKQIKHGKARIGRGADGITPRYMFGDEVFEGLAGQIDIRFISQKNYSLKVRGYFVKAFYEDLRLIARFDNQEIEATLNPSKYAHKKYFLGREIFPALDFEFDLSFQDITTTQLFSVEFYFVYSGKDYAPRMKQTWFSRFYNQNDFFIGDNFVVYNGNNRNSFQVERLIKEQHINQLVWDNRNTWSDTYLINKIIANFETYRNKRIWLFIDRYNRIDDNAEALFRYCSNIDDGIEKFMVVPDNSYYKNLITVGINLIIYGSFEYKFLLMFAEKYISSTTFYDSQPAFELRKMVNTFSNFDEVFLQHGVTQTTGVFENYLNSTRRDLALFCTSSVQEYQGVIDFSGFNKEQVRLTGLPRFDQLQSDPKKVIILAFTWRATLASAKAHNYNPLFKNSLFFQMFDGFITDERLIEALRIQGYRFIIKLHPNLYVQKQDFRIPKEMEIIENEISYQELYKISNVMITDASSAVFDFAYLKKPVIYYQDLNVPLNYSTDKGAFSYEKDGFGDIFDNKEDCINKLISYIENGCVMEEKYKARVDRFFTYRDQNNSERVYQEILKLPERTREELI